MKVAIGADHGGVHLKAAIKALLDELNVAYTDFGTDPVAKAVAAGEYDRGILICGTGIGIGIAANKVAGIRAALCHDTFSAHASREHNNANILTMGERVIGPGLAGDIVKIWLTTEFEGGRHERRVAKIAELEA